MESKQKTILDLCRELPDAAAEAELRTRAKEFNAEACWRVLNRPVSKVLGWDRYETNNGTEPPDCLDNIADAKAATDAVIARGIAEYHHWVFRCFGFQANEWTCEFERESKVSVTASTEQLARAACALLAAEAMREEMR